MWSHEMCLGGGLVNSNDAGSQQQHEEHVLARGMTGWDRVGQRDEHKHTHTHGNTRRVAPTHLTHPSGHL
jgi:hypothetical protein